MANEGNQRGAGNFANDPEKASEAGRKGGQQSQQGSQQSGGKSQQGGGQQRGGQQGSGSQDSDGLRGGSGNFANDPERASEAGRKGGQHSHGGK